MKRYFHYFTAAAAVLVLAAGCMEPKVKIYADFTTNKDVYELYEDVVVTNLSYAENAYVIASKWEWDGNSLYSHNPEEPFSFDKVGEYEIKLTVTSDVGNKSASCVKTVTVQDTNKRPVADFSWSPESGIAAGDKVQFTDKSYDPDGTVVGWEWKIGGSTVYDQNPEFTFTEFGDISVTLTVTDNMKGTASKSATIHVEKSVYSLELMWEKTYDSDGAYVKFTSPATNADGSVVYAFSSGYKLVAFSNEGEKLWTFDANKRNPNPYTSSGDKTGNSCTPAVDADGNIIFAVGYAEKSFENFSDYHSGIYSVTSNGAEKWYFEFGNARYIAVVPVILGDRVMLTTKANPTQANYPDLWTAYGSLDNGHVVDRNTGDFLQALLVKQGNYGGSVGLLNGKLITQCNTAYGTRLYVTKDGQFKFYGPNDNLSAKSLGYYNGKLETGDSSQMAVDKDGKVYILYTNNANRVSTKSVLYCYDTNKYVEDDDTAFEPEWVVGINGQVSRYNGHGVVLGEDGTVYVTTAKSGDNLGRVSAVSSTGQILWESTAPGNIQGSAAVDNQGYIYFNEYSAPSKLVKLSPVDGSRVSEVLFSDSSSDNFRSSPAIAADGTIYCTGMKNGAPVLIAVKGSATGPADSWSQLGGGPCRTCVKY